MKDSLLSVLTVGADNSCAAEGGFGKTTDLPPTDSNSFRSISELASFAEDIVSSVVCSWLVARGSISTVAVTDGFTVVLSDWLDRGHRW